MTSPRTGLILIPTAGERAILQPLLLDWIRSQHQQPWLIELCGFGPVAAAATTARLLQQHSVSQVLLLGIAGRYTSQLEIGAAYHFESVTQYGIGVGDGERYQSMSELGWAPLESMAERQDVDSIVLSPPAGPAAFAEANRVGRLLTVCSAAADAEDQRQRLAKYPDAVAEDMEGYAVALACEVAGVPLQIIRGISNDVGDRNHSRWQIQSALHSVMVVVRSANAT
ncbi:futalosine hydrolase [Roseimaritima ulvae]|uniref:Futalosine hydrolase n=1 Tax=Roseimaritima ulvae TaxID=980254 RepID=A0A5B9QQK0_9BACT|nr:futalosine hydrolase [Roseimaritima ulvae]QEG39785.1 Futalosine hydrolase [Roseimaritima ulvae]